jgi:5-methylcytosine-specific restriction enzyme B
MQIPDNITKEDLLQAIQKIDNEGIPPGGDSQYYDLYYNGRNYPPKLIVSYANIFANGTELNRRLFAGGRNTECFKLLEKKGFLIQPKSELGNFYSQIITFLEQAQTDDLRTKSYLKQYKGLQVKVSFGQGNPARIPWIALTREGQSVSNGVYPVYLYFKDVGVLILAYGISETNKPEVSWNLDPSIKKISETLLEHFNTDPDRYGGSWVYSLYPVSKEVEGFGLNEETVNEDLERLVEIYKSLPLETVNANKILIDPSSQSKRISQLPFDYKEFKRYTQASNLIFGDSLIIRFVSALCTKPFVILTGLAGSGKTKLAHSFAKWICEDESQYCMVPVGADWTNRDPLLGYPNALEANCYIKPENKALMLIIEAAKAENATKPYFIILDEMNLSHVERYFSDFLSAMESGGNIPLHSGNEDWDGVPSVIFLPKNLFIIGTVNIDETTYMFSPKVLDRANVIEFRVTADDMKEFLFMPKLLNGEKMSSNGAYMATDFINIATATTSDVLNSQSTNQALLDFFIELKKTGAEFGYRSATEINRFVKTVPAFEPSWNEDIILDSAIIQKLLPKVHGSRRKLEPVLKSLAGLCLLKKEDADKILNESTKLNFDDKTTVRFPLTLEKVIRMYKAAVQDGFTSFAEA